MNWAQVLLLAGGLAALGWCALVVADALLSQRSARQALEALRQTSESTAAPAPGFSGPRPAVARGSPLAELSIPHIHLSVIVRHGSDARTLRLGLGHIESTSLPGESGNVAIAGHRDSFFRPLRNIQIGDDILLDTPWKHLRYRVVSFAVVRSTEVGILAPTAAPTLTLVTCYPFWFIGEAPDRFVVRATRVADETSARSVPASYAVAPEPVAAPAAERVVAGPPKAGREVVADSTLVRQAVERFRATYNTGLASRREPRSGDMLAFQACSPPILGDHSATMACQSPSRLTDGQEPLMWTFTLGKAGGVWTVRRLAMQ